MLGFLKGIAPRPIGLRKLRVCQMDTKNFAFPYIFSAVAYSQFPCAWAGTIVRSTQLKYCYVAKMFHY